MKQKYNIGLGYRKGRLVVISTEPVSRGENGLAYWRCRCDCGTECIIRRGSLTPRSLQVSCGCYTKEKQREKMRSWRGDKHPSWKGGRHIRFGYVFVRVGDKYVHEHRVIMTQHLGRPLWPDETVHHRNGIRDDNRIENLELWAGNHAPGQRVEDRQSFALRTLAEYPINTNIPDGN